MNSFDMFKSIILDDVRKTIIDHSSKKKEDGSFSELLFKDFSMQSTNIKMGNVLERSWKKFIATIDGVVLDSRNKIMGSQIDILFDYNGMKYYFESKNNLNIDTEKTKATKEKVDKIVSFLKKENGDNNVIGKILNNRYNTSNSAKNYKRPITKEDICGYSEFFDIFNISVTQNDWETFFDEVGTYIIKELKH